MVDSIDAIQFSDSILTYRIIRIVIYQSEIESKK